MKTYVEKFLAVEVRTEVNVENTAHCSWCGEPLLVEQPMGKSYDGENMHFGCAVECDDDDIF